VQRDAAGFAAALAPLLGPGSRLHVSGCPKGCANPKASRFVAVADAGDYRLGFDRTAGSLFEGPAMDADALRAHFAALARPARSEGATHG
jgi:precorrin-3B synthase